MVESFHHDNNGQWRNVAKLSLCKGGQVNNQRIYGGEEANEDVG